MANKSLLKRLSFPARTSLVCINIGIIVTIFKQRSARSVEEEVRAIN